jgi:prepilin-type N-terminal cleavage/methylation domain-containing protein
MHGGQKGFTLIELLIVVAILGIIAAVVIPNVSRFMTTGELSAANSEAEQVKTAALGYFGEYGLWPDDSQELVDTGYITGELKATYDISGPNPEGNCGWLLAAYNQTWTGGIKFEGGADGPAGAHGEWIRSS